jgi:hypothetical protein
VACTIRFELARIDLGHRAGCPRTVIWMRASGDSDSSGVNSQLVPLNACTSSFWMRWRRSVLYLSRGTNTRHEIKRSKRSRRTNRRVRWCSCNRRMPSVMSNSSSSSAWNMSSRGYCSRMVTSDLYRWPLVRKPARDRMLAHLRRTSGISLVLTM